MSLLRPLARGLRALFRPRQADGDVAAEVRDYLERATAAHLARGLSPREARRAARLEVGDVGVVREQVRASGWGHGIETTAADVLHTLRRLSGSPTFTVTAVATLAVGIGASTAVFSVASPMLLEPLPFPHARRLVTVDD
ncbi:MAG: permease prefix domain 1-containing protein [Gemmatimonadetes bacterium]|nr:permease prefix domain 1-containing protein [Gemmatimonadota bacterium]